jgi:hypothetical protein
MGGRQTRSVAAFGERVPLSLLKGRSNGNCPLFGQEEISLSNRSAEGVADIPQRGGMTVTR